MPRILNPVVLVVDSLPKLCRDQQLEAYVKSLYGSVQACRCALVHDPDHHQRIFHRRCFAATCVSCTGMYAVVT